MPGRLFLLRHPHEIARDLDVPAPDLAAEPRANIAPGQDIMVLGPDRRLEMMRWGIIPVGRVNARGRPVLETIVNARSETVFTKSAFDGMVRCVIPADGWYEWTGPPRRKTAWRITRKDGHPVCFAAICDLWRAPGGPELWQAAILTCEPSADVREIHHRMGVILERQDVGTWLDGEAARAARLAVPLKDGLLSVGPAQDVDWSAP